MTIKGLWNLLEQKCNHVFETVPMSSFRGLRIAIDAGTWMFPLRMRARGNIAKRIDIVIHEVNDDDVDKEWYNIVVYEMQRFLEVGITPIIIFDGPSPPAKTTTKQKRTDDDDKRRAEIKRIRDKFLNSDRLRIDEADVLRLRALESQVGGVPQASRDRIKSFLKNLGIPCIPGGDGMEAERLASALVRHGIAAAVFSADGDCMPHGAGMIIRGFGEDILLEFSNDDGTYRLEKVKTFDIVRMSNVLSALQLTQEMFTEICILAGCDYNKNIKGLSIIDAHRNIREYNCVERIPFTQQQLEGASVLNLYVCRSLFERISFERMFDKKTFAAGLSIAEEALTHQDAFDVYVNLTYLAESLTRYWLIGQFPKLSKLYTELPKPRSYNNLTLVVDNYGHKSLIGDAPLEGIRCKHKQVESFSFEF